MIQLIRRIAAVALVGATLIASPALAVTWVTYAPDADGYRYWIDKDSLQAKGGYIYQVEVTDRKGQDWDMAIDATTGALLKDEKD